MKAAVLYEINDAFEALANGEVTRSVLDLT